MHISWCLKRAMKLPREDKVSDLIGSLRKIP